MTLCIMNMASKMAAAWTLHYEYFLLTWILWNIKLFMFICMKHSKSDLQMSQNQTSLCYASKRDVALCICSAVMYVFVFQTRNVPVYWWSGVVLRCRFLSWYVSSVHAQFVCPISYIDEIQYFLGKVHQLTKIFDIWRYSGGRYYLIYVVQTIMGDASQRTAAVRLC